MGYVTPTIQKDLLTGEELGSKGRLALKEEATRITYEVGCFLNKVTDHYGYTPGWLKLVEREMTECFKLLNAGLGRKNNE